MPRTRRKNRLMKFNQRLANILPMFLVLLLLATFGFYVPVYPTITVSFTISPNPINSADAPVVATLFTNYQKLSASASATIQKGQIVVAGLSNGTKQNAQQYSLLIYVNYGSSNS